MFNSTPWIIDYAVNLLNCNTLPDQCDYELQTSGKDRNILLKCRGVKHIGLTQGMFDSTPLIIDYPVNLLKSSTPPDQCDYELQNFGKIMVFHRKVVTKLYKITYKEH